MVETASIAKENNQLQIVWRAANFPENSFGRLSPDILEGRARTIDLDQPLVAYREFTVKDGPLPIDLKTRQEWILTFSTLKSEIDLKPIFPFAIRSQLGNMNIHTLRDLLNLPTSASKGFDSKIKDCLVLFYEQLALGPEGRYLWFVLQRNPDIIPIEKESIRSQAVSRAISLDANPRRVNFLKKVLGFDDGIPKKPRTVAYPLVTRPGSQPSASLKYRTLEEAYLYMYKRPEERYTLEKVANRLSTDCLARRIGLPYEWPFEIDRQQWAGNSLRSLGLPPEHQGLLRMTERFRKQILLPRYPKVSANTVGYFLALNLTESGMNDADQQTIALELKPIIYDLMAAVR